MALGAWPPASPWVFRDSWWDADGNPFDIILNVRFDSPVNGGGTNVLQGVDYDLDPGCPWTWLIVVKSDNVSRLTFQIPRTSRTGTISKTQLNAWGLTLFTDIGSVTLGVTQN